MESPYSLPTQRDDALIEGGELVLQRTELVDEAPLVDMMLKKSRSRDYIAAKAIADSLLLINPYQPMIRHHRVDINIGLGLTDEALDDLNLLISNHPTMQMLHIKRLRLLAKIGRFDEACELADQLRASGIEHPALTMIEARGAYDKGDYERTVTLTQSALTDTTIDPAIRKRRLFLCGSAYDKLDQPDKAMEALELANALHYDQCFDKAPFASLVDRLLAFYNRKSLPSIPRSTNTCDRPAFLVSMPRAGSSLVHQIVDSNPRAHGVGETGYFYGRRQRMGAAYPANLMTISVKDLDYLADRYMTGQGKPLEADTIRTLDKSIDNFRDLNLIWQILPGSRYIDLKRDPYDCCFSIYQHEFNSPNITPYTSRLEDIAFVYKMQERLKRHWKEVLEMPVLEVVYEDLIADQVAHTKRILEFLGLPWSEQCLRFYESKRTIDTMSQTQVKRPIYRDSIGKGEKYAKYMVGVRRILESD